MAIQALDKLPEKVAKISDSDKAYQDIQEALDKGIEAFEFVGDYNYKYLTTKARWAADIFTRRAVRKVYYDHKSELQDLNVVWAVSYVHRRIDRKWITIIGKKLEDRKHVYCKINPEVLASIPALLEEAKNEDAKAREEREARRKAQEEQE